MGRRIASFTTLTPTATADTTALVGNTYPHVFQGGSATQLTRFWEISIVGQAASTSSPTFMIFSRDSTVGVGALTYGGTVGNDTALDPSFQSLGTVAGSGSTFATTQAQRSATAHLMNCSLNAFGGVYFWRANRLEECPGMLGNTQPLGECSLSAFTGGTPGACGTHVEYETA
jgi:hypothetical protein